MLVVEPRMKDIRLMRPGDTGADLYYKNLKRSPMCDMSTLPSGGGGYLKPKVQGMTVDRGRFRNIKLGATIEDRKNIRNNLGIKMTPNQCKLPRPVVQSNFKTVRQQVLKNVADVNNLTVNDLDETNRNNVLSNKRLEQSLEDVNPIKPKLDILKEKQITPVPIDTNSEAFKQLGATSRMQEPGTEENKDNKSVEEYIKQILEEVRRRKESNSVTKK